MSSRYFFAWQMIDEAERSDERNVQNKLHAQLRELNNALTKNTENKFIKLYRLSKGAFNFLCDILRTHTTLRSSERVTLEAKVLSVLLFYANGDYQRVAGEANLFSQSSMSIYIKEVTEALNTNTIINKFIRFPTTRHERDIIKQRFYLKRGIPGVIGCIDATHIKIFTPSKNEEHLFYCRKHYHSLNVQMICDDNYRILAVNPKYGGATHDSFIWENSNINNYMQNLHRSGETVWLLGDSGYPQRPWLMIPYSDTVPGSIEDNFNKKHCIARVAIENNFGRLKNRWRCLSKDRVLHYQPAKCAKIIIACCVLHNLAFHFNLPEPEHVIDDGEVNIHQGIQLSESEANNTDLIRGRVLRDQVASRLIEINIFIFK